MLINDNVKVVVGVILLVALIVVLFRVYPARPPLPYTNNAGSNDGIDGGQAQRLQLQLDSMREEVERLKLRRGGPGTSGADASGSSREPSSTCAACPPCSVFASNCPACPECPSPASVAALPPPPAASASAAARCAKFPLQFPAQVKRLTIQIGAHLSPLRSEGPEHAILSFEPQVALVAKIRERNLQGTYMVPAAVSIFDGLAVFDLAGAHDQSATLNKFDPKIASWSGEKIVVPVVRMQTVLECIGIEEIDSLLCDAQGSDLDVMKSAGPLLRRFKRIEMEVQVNKFKYYQSENSKPAVVAYMKSQGFREIASHCNGVDPALVARDPSVCEEENVTFLRE